MIFGRFVSVTMRTSGLVMGSRAVNLQRTMGTSVLARFFGCDVLFIYRSNVRDMPLMWVLWDFCDFLALCERDYANQWAFCGF